MPSLYAEGNSNLIEGLLGLEEEDGAVPEVEVYEVLRFVGYEGSEVAPNDAVPSRALSLIEL